MNTDLQEMSVLMSMGDYSSSHISKPLHRDAPVPGTRPDERTKKDAICVLYNTVCCIWDANVKDFVWG